MSVENNATARRIALRGALLLSTAIGATFACGAHAQTVSQNATTDISYTDQATVSGTPNAIDLRSNGGTVTLNANGVTGSAPANTGGNIVYLSTTGASAINATIATLTATGAGDIFGFYAKTDAGAINVAVGTVDLAGNSTPGVFAISNSGNITLSGTAVYTRGLNQNPTSQDTGDGLVGVSTTGSVTVTNGSGQSDSIYGTVAAAVGGAGATVNSTYAKTTGIGGAAVTARSSAGDARATSATIETTGSTGSAIEAIADVGQAFVTSGTITGAGTGSTGINARGAAGVTVNSGTISTGGRAINATSTGGNVSVTTTGDTLTRTASTNAIFASGANVTVTTAGTVSASGAGNPTILIAATGAASLTSDIVTNTGTSAAINAAGANGVTIAANTVNANASTGNIVFANATTAGNAGVTVGTVTGSAVANAISATAQNGSAAVTAGSVTNSRQASNAFGIFASGKTGASVNAGTVSAEGQAIRAQSSAGTVSVTTTGDITSRALNAISISALGFDVTTAANTTVTSNGGTAAIAGGASAGNASVTNNGTIAARGSAETGIGVTASGNVTVISKTITVEGLSAPTSTFTSGGISAVSNNGGTVSVTSDAITVGGARRVGIIATTTGAGTATVTSGSLTKSQADDYQTVVVTTDTGALRFDSRSINTALSANAITTIAELSSNSGAITGNVGNIVTTGIGSVSGVEAFTAGNIDLTAGTFDLAGSFTRGVYAESTAGNVTLAGTSITVRGTGFNQLDNITGDGLDAIARQGRASVTSGYGSNDSLYGSVAAAVGKLGATVASTEARTSGEGGAALYAQSDSGDAAITSGTIVMTALNVAGAQALANVGRASIVSASVTDMTSGNVASGIFARGAAGASVTSGTVSVGGTGIRAQSAAGDVSITATGATTTVAGSAIFANAAGAVDIKAATVAVTGPGTDPGVGTSGLRVPQGGIIAKATSGAIGIESGTVTVAGQFRYGIEAEGTGAISIKSTDLTLASADSVGIAARGGTGNVSIESGRLVTTGASGAGVLGTTTSGNIVLSAVDTRLMASGIQGNFTADAVTGISSTGSVQVTSGYASTAGFAGSAAVAIGGAATVNSTTAITTGDQGTAIIAQATNGSARVTSGTVSASGAGAVGIFASGTTGTRVDSTGAISTTGFGIRAISAGAGDVLVNSASVSTTAVGAYGVLGQSKSGAVAIDTTGAITTAGNARITGNRVFGAFGVYAISEAGPITVNNAANITTTGSFAAAIEIEAGRGIITATPTGPLGTGPISVVNGGALRTASGAGIYLSGGDSAISVTNNGSIATTGATSAGILVQPGNGIRAIVNTGSITTASGTTSAGITLATGTGASTIANSGSIAAATSEGVRVIEIGQTVTTSVAVQNSGSITGGLNGLYLEGGTTAYTVNNAVGGAITGAQAGVRQTFAYAGATGGVVQYGTTAQAIAITNAGMIASSTGAAIVTSGTTNLVNSGTISGTGARAVLLNAGDDRVELRTGSAVNGIIDFGAGNDVMVLNGSGTTASAAQTVAASANLETLNVASGYWTANSGHSVIGTLAIASGATLEVGGQAVTTIAASGRTPVDGEIRTAATTLTSFGVPLEVGSIVNTGTLALNFNTGLTANIDDGIISGTGGVRFIGTDAVNVRATGLTYTGATTVAAGTVTLTSNLVGDVVTVGSGTFRLGNGGTSGTLQGNLVNNGSFVYDRSDSYTLAGNFTGSGSFTKLGAGTLTVGGTYGFTGTTMIAGGRVAFTGTLAPTTELDLRQGTLDLSMITGGRQTVGELAGTSMGAVALGGSSLTVSQTTNTQFDGTITGTGGLTKTGTGTLNLTGTSTYSGTTDVSGGTLKVNGALPNSTVQVGAGGTLGGNGTVGGLTSLGGILAPGNSIGRITVQGNIALNAASIFQVEANNLGQADRVDATGTAALGGAQVQVLAASGIYRPSTNYTILTAAGGITGTFGGVTSNLAFLTPSLAYSGTAVTLTLARNNIAFASAGTNANERGAGAAVQALGAGNALFEAALTLTDSGAAPAFASVTGELHAALPSGLIEDTQPLRTTVLGLVGGHSGGLYGWASGVAATNAFKRIGSTARLSDDLLGGLGGIGYAGDGFDMGIGGGATRAEYRSGAPGSSANVDTGLIVAYAGYGSGPLKLKLGTTIGFDSIDGTRVASVGTLTETLAARYHARTVQGFGEIAYDVAVRGAAITPFAGLAYVHTGNGAFAETGGTAALRVAANARNVTYGTLGLRLAPAPVSSGRLVIQPYLSGAWRHGFGDRTGTAVVSFASGGQRFGITGAGIVEDAADIGGGVALQSGNFGLRAAYTGVIGKDFTDHGAKISLSYRF